MNDSLVQILLIIVAALGGLSGLLVLMTKLEPRETRARLGSKRTQQARLRP